MFEEFARMFSSDDTEVTEEPTEETDTDEDPVEFGETPPDAEPQRGADTGDDVDVDVEELDVRLEELEDEVDSTASSLRALQNTQEEMNESVSEMNDTVRRLAGIYDHLTAADNPFADDPTGPGDSSDQGFEFVGEEAGADAMERFADQQTADDAADADDVVSFDDLAEQRNGDSADDSPAQHAGRDADPAADADPSPPADDSAVAEPPAEAPDSAADWPPGTADTTAAGDERPVLASVPDTYAGDALMMEWLAGLMQHSGPAGALRAIEHYEDVGWLSPTVTAHLVDVLGGPSLDVFVDPMQPREPTADEHALSYRYIRAIDRLSDI